MSKSRYRIKEDRRKDGSVYFWAEKGVSNFFGKFIKKEGNMGYPTIKEAMEVIKQWKKDKAALCKVEVIYHYVK